MFYKNQNHNVSLGFPAQIYIIFADLMIFL